MPFRKSFSVLLIEHAMAVALKIRVGNLLPKFLTDALIVLGAIQSAGAVAAGTLQTFPDGTHHLFILIESNCHKNTSILLLLYRLLILCQ